MMVALAVLAVVFHVWRKMRRKRRNNKAAASPLAGVDTGTRSGFRAPGSVRFHRGF